uniref:CSLF3-cellulose synthase-like family F n=1 Tax=Arundo donax TaxID=35708 RepID=A0A0A9AF70_ARUDO
MLFYVSREKNPSYDHNKKAGALKRSCGPLFSSLMGNSSSTSTATTTSTTLKPFVLRFASCLISGKVTILPLFSSHNASTMLIRRIAMAITIGSSLMEPCLHLMACKGPHTSALVACSAA